MDERVIESRRVYEGKIVQVRVDRVQMHDGRTALREVVEHSQAVAVVPVTEDGRIIMVRQFRLPVGRPLLELPAGSLDEGEDAATAAQRELQEETGQKAARLTRLGGIYVAPGYCTEYIHLYLAEGLSESKLDADDDEHVEVELYTLDDLLAKLETGEVEDAKSMSGLLAYARRLAQI